MITEGTNILRQHKLKNLKFEPKLKQITFLESRVYQRDDNLYYPSVTTILQYMPKGKFFEQWLKDVGYSADIILEKAGREGSQVHEAIEAMLNGEEISWIDDFGNAKYSLQVWKMILKAAEFFEKYKPKIIAVEVFLYSDQLQYAGTVDLVVELDGEIWLIDIKTSNALYKSYDLQTAAYAKAWEEMGKGKIDRTGILWLKSKKRGEDPKGKTIQGKGWELKPIDDVENNYKLFQSVYDIYKIDNPKVEPIYNRFPTTVKLNYG